MCEKRRGEKKDNRARKCTQIFFNRTMKAEGVTMCVRRITIGFSPSVFGYFHECKNAIRTYLREILLRAEFYFLVLFFEYFE